MEIFQLQTPSDPFEQAMNRLMMAYNRENSGSSEPLRRLISASAPTTVLKWRAG